MKRYTLGVAIDWTNETPVPIMTEHPAGEWVRWDNVSLLYKSLTFLKESYPEIFFHVFGDEALKKADCE